MQESGDRHVLELMRRRGTMTIHELVEASSVTATAVRHRLNKLMNKGLIERMEEREGRGRPSYRYYLTARAHDMLGQNYSELAMTLWHELKDYEDRAIGMKILKRVATRLAQNYRQALSGQDLRTRLGDLKDILCTRGIDVEVDESGQLPVLRQHSCPYNELAEQDRTVCGIEMRMLEESLDEDVKLSQCRLDGHQCCEFEIVSAAQSS